MIDQHEYYQQRQEVHLTIEWPDSIETTRHATCEDAFVYERQRKREEASRRRKADRRYPVRSYYYGRTSTDKTYGGILTHSYSCVLDEEHLQDAHHRTVRFAFA
jgi:hypothetical protein